MRQGRPRPKAAVFLAFWFALAGCGDDGSEASTRPPSVLELLPTLGSHHPVLRALEGFVDDVCACKDPVCVERVEKRLMDWAIKDIERLKQAVDDFTPDEKAAADRLDDRMNQCKRKALRDSPGG